MPPTIQFSNDLIATAIADGTLTPALAPLALAALGGTAVAWVKTNEHFLAVARDPGHWDDGIDDECVAVLDQISRDHGLPEWTDADRLHMEEWPAAYKEIVRRKVCKAIANDQPFYLRWMAKLAIRKPQLIEEQDGLLFVQPAANVCK